MQPELHIGGITLQTFGLMMGLAFVVAGWIVSKRLKELGKPVDWAYEMVFAALIGGIVGARRWRCAPAGRGGGGPAGGGGGAAGAGPRGAGAPGGACGAGGGGRCGGAPP